MKTEIDWGMDVSRETSERLECYEALLKKWNPAINLVSKSTISELRTRHMIDSAQIFELAPSSIGSWVDLGSGGGFPGLVCAVIAAEKSPRTKFHLIESDTRKAAFLMTVARETGLNAQVHSQRIEMVKPLLADVLSARALAPLDKLLEFATLHMSPGGVALFPKGVKFRDELNKARERWSFEHNETVSITDKNAVIIKVRGIKRA